MPDEHDRSRIEVELRQVVHSASFRPYSSTDVIGCELGGTTKIEITTWRCQRCGYLESYAGE